MLGSLGSRVENSSVFSLIMETIEYSRGDILSRGIAGYFFRRENGYRDTKSPSICPLFLASTFQLFADTHRPGSTPRGNVQRGPGQGGKGDPVVTGCPGPAAEDIPGPGTQGYS